MNAIPQEVLRESEIAGTLEQICQELELTPTQYEDAKSKYEAVGAWLAGSNNNLLAELTVYAHGSVALGTTNKPHGRLEHDVDLVARAAGVTPMTAPWALKRAMGDRLKEHAYYASILEEKRRCWRLNYAGEFHLDLTPSIFNPACGNGGELVPDKELRRWKASNPQGYRDWFTKLAQQQPRILLAKAMTEDRAYAADRADVAPYPRQMPLKGVLRRTVQLSKRHRDIYFEFDTEQVAPISIVITTLLARAYEISVGLVYQSELQLIVEMIRLMPRLIEGPATTGHRAWKLWNPTTEGENFAEKWNSNAALPAAFLRWHAKLLADVENMTSVFGFDALKKSLSESFGPRPVKKAMDAMIESVSAARERGTLRVAPSIGLTSAAVAASTSVRGNTFFGA
jgi:hypothetical protein